MLRRTILTLTAVASMSVATASNADVLTAFSFENNAIGVNNSPAPSVGTGTLNSIGMTNNFTSPPSVANCDVIAQQGSSNPNAGNQTWRVRGGGTGSGNGWAAAAPQYSQGLEVFVSTVNFQDVVLSYDWSPTTQGVKHQQVQYTIDGTNWLNFGNLLVGPATEGWVNGNTFDFTGVSGVDNNALFGIRIVSAYAPDGPNAGQYVNLAGNVINSTSGNWRFDTISLSANPIPEPASLGLALLAVPVLMRRRIR
jgi:hypothetical protein